jgi:hypothetical protein
MPEITSFLRAPLESFLFGVVMTLPLAYLEGVESAEKRGVGC